MAGEIKKFVTPPFVASWTNTVFEAKSVDGGEPKYGLTAIWDPSRFTEADKKRWAAIQGEMDSEALRLFKKKMADLPANFKKGLRDAAEKEGMEGYEAGKLFASLTTKLKPGVVKRMPDGTSIDVSVKDGNADEIYPGCICRATVTVYAYDNKGKGVALGLMNLQKIADGARIDGRTNASADFADEEVDNSWLEQDDEIPF